MEEMLTENVMIDTETGDLYLVYEDGEINPSNIRFEFDRDTGNCYIDESTVA